jgi:pyruvate formate lyase activating enzyme
MNSIEDKAPINGRRGIVFNIQRFSIHDGPGIRTTVFAKGCPLKCAWCSNPESQKLFPQLMVREVKCTRCGRCAEACPDNAISLTEEHGRKINWDLCSQCFKCTEVCIYESLGIIGKDMGIEEIVKEVEKDRIFYKNSGGGVTISGGEPLLQNKFVLNLIKAFKEKDINTALDTCGYVSEEVFREILPFVDLLLLDIKQLDSERHQKYTGVDNSLILTNALTFSKKVRTWFRIPLIKDFNDSPEDIRKIAEMASELGVEKISLLPYHEGGKSKSFQIGNMYSIPMAKAPDNDHIQRLKNIVSKIGVAVTIGN